MVRTWTEQETNALREYINSHLGHINGLTGSYWDELSLVLEGVRRTGDSVLKKNQVSNKIILFRRKEVSCSHVLEYGITDEKHKKSQLEDNQIESAPASRTESQSSGCLVERPLMLENDVQAITSFEKDSVFKSVLSASRGSEHHLKCKAGLRTPLRSGGVGVSPHGIPSSAQSRSRHSLKRVRSDDSCKTSTYSLSKNRSNRRKRATQKRHEESVPIEQAVKGPMYESNYDTGESFYCVNEQIPGARTTSIVSSKDLPESDTLSVVDMKTLSVWQSQMLFAWETHLKFQSDINIIQQEPIDHREVLYTVEDIWNRMGNSSEVLQEMFPRGFDVSALGPSGTLILSTLTGHKSQSELADHLRIAQSLSPLSGTVNLLRALVGATIHRWIFEGYRKIDSGRDHHNPSRTVLENFIQRDCPKLWASYQSLYHHQFLSSYSEDRIVTEAKRLAGDAYAFLSAGYSMSGDIHASLHAGDSIFSNSFSIQAQHYQTFKNNMIEAYRLALGLRVSLAKCNDLTYDFHFPVMNDKFDASCMEVKNWAGDEGTINGVDRSIAVCLLPSIWSRARRDSEYGRPITLVTKAIVLM